MTDIAFSVNDLEAGWIVAPTQQYELGEDRGTIGPGDSFEVMQVGEAVAAATSWALLRRVDPNQTEAWEPFVVSTCESMIRPRVSLRFRKITPHPTPTPNIWRLMHGNGTAILNTSMLGHALSSARDARARGGYPVFIAHYTAQKVYTIEELDAEFTGVDDD